MKINIIDAPMGAGKTSAAINYMNSNKDNYKFIYITPYLDEVERVCKACDFKKPVNLKAGTPKLIHLKSLLNKGENIVTTHSLFHYFDDEVIDLCYSQNYVLIMDEVTNVVEQYPIAKKDLDILTTEFTTIDENGILHWTSDSYTMKFEEEKRLCDMECLAVYSNMAMMWMFPVKIFKAFRESFILTYMFDAQIQKYYYDFYNFEYKYMYIAGNDLSSYHFTDEIVKYKGKYNYSELINILEDRKLNAIGDDRGSLSKAWYIRNSNNVLIKQLKQNLYNFFNNRLVFWNGKKYVTSTSPNNLWTTFIDYKKALSGGGYAKGFIPCNMRATNEYRDRSVVAYAINKYLEPVIKQFFISKGVDVHEDRYALSEMLQFIWRSAIRDGKHITVYIPSRRMRELLIDWINKQQN